MSTTYQTASSTKQSKELDKFVDNFASVDLEDDLTINQLALTIDELIEPYKVNVAEVGLQVAQDNKALIVKLKNKIAKVFKARRDHYNAMSKKIISVEKAISEPLYLAEEELKEACEKEHNRQVIEQRTRLLPQRKAYLQSLDLSFPDDLILALDEGAFNELIEVNLSIKEQEAKQQLEKENWQKENAERIRLEAEQIIIEKAQLDEDIKKHQEAQTLKNQKVQEFLKINGYRDGGLFRVIQEGNKVTLFKAIATLDLDDRQEMPF